MSMPQVHLVAYCGDLGYGPRAAPRCSRSCWAWASSAASPRASIADRIGGAGTLVLGSALQCLALLFYLPFDGLTSLYLVSALFGLSQGGIVPSYALIVRDYFPAREAGTRVSLVLTATILGMALGGWLSGEIFDLTGSYRAAFLNGIALEPRSTSPSPPGCSSAASGHGPGWPEAMLAGTCRRQARTAGRLRRGP